MHKPDPLGWCDCPRVDYYQGYMMCGHKVSHRLYHLIATKWPSLEIDIKLYGTKPVFIDRFATRGRGNSTFRYSAENPPKVGMDQVIDELLVDLAKKRRDAHNAELYKDAHNCTICACWLDTGHVQCGIHEPHRKLECGCRDFCTCPIGKFKKAKLSGGLCRLGCKCDICVNWTKGLGEDTHDKEVARWYGLPATDGLKLCPGRKEAW